MMSRTATMASVAERIAALDWQALEASLWEGG